MTAYTGSALDVKWIDGSGTVTISGDQTILDYTPSIDLVDQTAGADTNKTYLTTLKDGKASLTAYLQAGTASGGTLAFSRVYEGAVGTIIYSPEGTAATKPKYTLPVIAMGAAFSYPFAGNVEAKVDFQQNGARTEGTN
jgi:hypothetical protein